MIKVSSKIKLNIPVINELSDAAVTALEQTAEALHTEVVQACVVPRKDGIMQGEIYIKAGTESVTEYEDGTQVINSISKAKNGTVVIGTTGPQVRRLYYHPEYNFNTGPWEEFIVEKDGKKHRFDTKDKAKEYVGKSKLKISHLTHEGNPNAKGKWFEDWEEGGKYEDYCLDAFKRLYRRLADL